MFITVNPAHLPKRILHLRAVKAQQINQLFQNVHGNQRYKN